MQRDKRYIEEYIIKAINYYNKNVKRYNIFVKALIRQSMAFL